MPFGQNNDEPTIFVVMIKSIIGWVGVILSILILLTWEFHIIWTNLMQLIQQKVDRSA